MTGTAEHLILMRNHLGVLFHERHTDIAQVEFFGLIAEEFAVYTRPEKPAIGVDVNFADTHLGGR